MTKASLIDDTTPSGGKVAPENALIGGLYEPWIVRSLIEAAANSDIAALDEVTDAMAAAGLVRARTESGMFEPVSRPGGAA